VSKEWYNRLRYGRGFHLGDLMAWLQGKVAPELFIAQTGEFTKDGAESFLVLYKEQCSFKIPIPQSLMIPSGNYIQEPDGSYSEVFSQPPIDHYVASIQVFWDEKVSENFSGYENFYGIPVVYWEGKFLGNLFLITEDTKEKSKELAIDAAKLGAKAVKETAKGLFNVSKFAYRKYQERNNR
jgi:glutaredoxin-related protein